MSAAKPLFQSTRPQGARPIDTFFANKSLSFNPRARRGRDCESVRSSTTCSCFNPRARRGRDSAILYCIPPFPCFNPRARRGRDHQIPPLLAKHRVSIHAPAGGATVTCHPLPPVYPVSIHAPAGGATTVNWTTSSITAFQSTRPQGARPCQTGKRRENRCFNPRARRGRDWLMKFYPVILLSFNPRARRGRDR